MDRDMMAQARRFGNLIKAFGYDYDGPLDKADDEGIYSPGGAGLILSLGSIKLSLGNTSMSSLEHDGVFEMLALVKEIGFDPIALMCTGYDGEDGLDEERELADKLKEQGVPILPNVDQPETTAEIFVQGTIPDDFERLVRGFSTIAMLNAQLSVQENNPNYVLMPHALADVLSNKYGVSMQKDLDLPPYLEGHTNCHGGVVKRKTDSLYVRAIVPVDGNTFTYDIELEKIVGGIANSTSDSDTRSQLIFQWIRNNIAYGKEKRTPEKGYRSALDTFNDLEGVCGESAALQVTMERLAGNEAFLASYGDKHAVAFRISSEGRFIGIDTTHDGGYDFSFEPNKIGPIKETTFFDRSLF